MTPLALTAIAVIGALGGAAQAGVGLGELALIGGVGILLMGVIAGFGLLTQPPDRSDGFWR
jgi:hypothetical protein